MALVDILNGVKKKLNGVAVGLVLTAGAVGVGGCDLSYHNPFNHTKITPQIIRGINERGAIFFANGTANKGMREATKNISNETKMPYCSVKDKNSLRFVEVIRNSKSNPYVLLVAHSSGSDTLDKFEEKLKGLHYDVIILDGMTSEEFSANEVTNIKSDFPYALKKTSYNSNGHYNTYVINGSNHFNLPKKAGPYITHRIKKALKMRGRE